MSDPAPPDFSEATRRAALELRRQDDLSATTEAEAARTEQEQRREAVALLAPLLDSCATELRRLRVNPERRRVQLSYTENWGTKLKGWLLPLRKEEVWERDIELWVGKDAKRWAVVSGKHWRLDSISDPEAPLPAWDLSTGGGKGSEGVGTVRVVVDPAVDGGLRWEFEMRRGPGASEPFREALVRGVAKVAMDAGRL